MTDTVLGMLKLRVAMFLNTSDSVAFPVMSYFVKLLVV